MCYKSVRVFIFTIFQSSLPEHLVYDFSESASPDEDSESVCSSLDGCSVVSEEGGGSLATATVMEEETDEDLDFHLAELIDQLTDKK